MLVSAVLVLVFGSLFASADPEFGHLLWRATPSFYPGEVGRAIVGLLVAVVLALGFGYLAAGRPVFDAVPPGSSRSVRRSEWAVPLAVLDGLFVAFVAVQLATLFGGRARVLRTAGLTYAQYARSGFWQLLVVAGLTLVVIGVAVRVAGRTAPVDRALLRILLGALATLTLVIVASALQRLSVYDDAYGFTRLRLAVGVTEMWLGLVFVLVLVAGLRLRAPWLPRLAAATAVLALLLVAGVGPDRFIAQHNVDRYDRTGRIDVAYLATLSADAVPELERLPQPVRDCVLGDIGQRLDRHPDDWRSWNLGRERARTLLDPDRIGRC